MELGFEGSDLGCCGFEWCSSSGFRLRVVPSVFFLRRRNVGNNRFFQ